MKTLSSFFKPMLTAGLLCLALVTAFSQNELMARLDAEEQDALSTLVLYPEEFRDAILEATLYPEALIRMQRLQGRSADAFRQLVEDYSQEGQALLWELSRYPELVQRLATDTYGSPLELELVLRDYPEPIQEKARRALVQYPTVLVKMSKLLEQTETEFEGLLLAYPAPAREALYRLMELPEALSLLNEHIEMTILLGDSYRNDPTGTLRQLDALHLEAARQRTEELAGWQETLEKDPKAMNELRQAAAEYTEEYGYDDEYYDFEPEQREVVVYYRYVPYTYWFGYPHWYSFPRWRPVPVWYDYGFYIFVDAPVIIHWLPSRFFVHWYFHRPRHHYYYPHLSDRFVHHVYYGPRTIGSPISAGVRTWQRTNRDIISEGWLRDENRRIDRIREFGQFEAARQQANEEKPARQRSQTEFLEQNRNRYPNLRTYQDQNPPAREPAARQRAPEPSTARPAPDPTNKERDREVDRQRDTQPPKVVPKAPERPKVEPKTTERPKVEPQRPKVTPKTTERPKVERQAPAPPKVTPKRSEQPQPPAARNKTTEPKKEKTEPAKQKGKNGGR